MCCLKFENEVYTHLKKGMPAVGERIKTPDGMAIVSDVNILENIIKTRLVLDNGKKDENGEEKLSTDFTITARKKSNGSTRNTVMAVTRRRKRKMIWQRSKVIC